MTICDDGTIVDEHLVNVQTPQLSSLVQRLVYSFLIPKSNPSVSREKQTFYCINIPTSYFLYYVVLFVSFQLRKWQLINFLHSLVVLGHVTFEFISTVIPQYLEWAVKFCTKGRIS